ncbi:MAG: MBL fold metallo-hydrolase [Bacteroidota bacterium]|jgi:phosphoribosyl 1,2-cyclic phosphate phosphodiesterase
MNVTFLGTGTSQGIPVIGCKCIVCISNDSKDKRLRTSALIELNGVTIVIDSGPDFRQQMLRENVNHVDAILFTHEHKDHMAGLDDVRAYNYLTKKAMDIYGSKCVHEAIKRDFHYVFHSEKYPGVPDLNLKEISDAPFWVNDVRILPIKVKHHKMNVNAFRINDFTYITDANKIEDNELEKVKGSKIIVLNALRKEPHISHFTLHQAIQLLTQLKPEKAYLTHFSHQLGLHKEIELELPEFILPAYDGLKICI